MSSLPFKLSATSNLTRKRLSSEQVENVNGIKCSPTVKYLGIKIAVEKKE
jgi:hypothetical protein